MRIQTKDLYLRIVAPRIFVCRIYARGSKRDPTPHWENVESL